MQDLGKESVEERVTGVDEVEAMRDEFSLRLKTKEQNRNKNTRVYFFLANFYMLHSISYKQMRIPYIEEESNSSSVISLDGSRVKPVRNRFSGWKVENGNVSAIR